MKTALVDSAEILSLNTGLPIDVMHKNKLVRTAIYKNPVETGLYLSTLHFEGDGQADLQHHGGADKAVCVYPSEHLTHFEKELGILFNPGAFGENLTTKGMLETQLCIGDIYRLGDAFVQVSQPRQPCFKLSVKFNLPTLPLLVQTTGYTGFYFRVLQEGFVSPQSVLQLEQREPMPLTVSYANHIMHIEKQDLDGAQRILSIPALSASWRKTLTNRLKGEALDTSSRLNGV